MSLIKTVDGKAINIDELTLITPLIIETGLPRILNIREKY